MPRLHDLDVPMAAVAAALAAVEVWRWRRGKANGWWAVFYLMSGFVFLAFAARRDL